MTSLLLAWLRHLSRICGFDSVDSFPAGHPYARTRWHAAYFDIASDVRPEQIEARLCAAIANTPTVFAHISNPTRRMQRALLGVLDERVRRRGNTGELVALLEAAYRSPHVPDAVPGLRDAIEQWADAEPQERQRQILAFLAAMPAPFDSIDALDLPGPMTVSAGPR